MRSLEKSQKLTQGPLCQPFILFLLVSSLSSIATAGEGPTKSNIKPNTQVYESDPVEATLTSTVRILRNVQDEWEVAFDQGPGLLTVPDDGASQPLLADAQKTKTPVIVRYNKEKMKIISVQPSSRAQGTSPSSSRGN